VSENCSSPAPAQLLLDTSIVQDATPASSCSGRGPRPLVKRHVPTQMLVVASATSARVKPKRVTLRDASFHKNPACVAQSAVFTTNTSREGRQQGSPLPAPCGGRGASSRELRSSAQSVADPTTAFPAAAAVASSRGWWQRRRKTRGSRERAGGSRERRRGRRRRKRRRRRRRRRGEKRENKEEEVGEGGGGGEEQPRAAG